MTTPQPQHLLQINTKYHWTTFTFAAFKPIATVNGAEYRLTWGANQVPIGPGPNEVTVHVPYLWKVGKATTTVMGGGEHPAPLHYAAPALAFVGGAIGTEPQKHPALIVQWLMLGLLGLILVCCCGGTVLTALVNGTSTT